MTVIQVSESLLPQQIQFSHLRSCCRCWDLAVLNGLNAGELVRRLDRIDAMLEVPTGWKNLTFVSRENPRILKNGLQCQFMILASFLSLFLCFWDDRKNLLIFNILKHLWSTCFFSPFPCLVFCAWALQRSKDSSQELLGQQRALPPQILCKPQVWECPKNQGQLQSRKKEVSEIWRKI